MSELIAADTGLAAIVKSRRDLAVLARHGYTQLAQIREQDRVHFREWGIKDIDLIIAAADEARTR